MRRARALVVVARARILPKNATARVHSHASGAVGGAISVCHAAAMLAVGLALVAAERCFSNLLSAVTCAKLPLMHLKVIRAEMLSRPLVQSCLDFAAVFRVRGSLRISFLSHCLERALR